MCVVNGFDATARLVTCGNHEKSTSINFDREKKMLFFSMESACLWNYAVCQVKKI